MQQKRSRKVSAGLIVVGFVIGALIVTPAGAHLGGKVKHLWKDHIMPKADARYALTGHDHDDRYYIKAEVDTLLGSQRFIETGNGVGNNLGCTTGLAVRVANGLDIAVDGRFTFQVPGPSAEAWGHIRSDASIRSGSANVTSVLHPETGIYCVQFSGGGLDPEGAVVSIHVD